MSESRGADAGSAARMEAIATLPVFFKLRGKPVVIAGGDAPAVWKAELLAAAGARVQVFAAQPCAAMIALAADLPNAAIAIVPRAWQPEDLHGAAVALASIEDESEAAAFQQAARAAGVPVNVIDKPAYCDFQFGTIVARSPLVIGISTDGAAPVFGQAIRARIEALLPDGLRRWAQAAQDWRPAVQARGLDFRTRRRFWEAFTQRALSASTASPSTADQDACFAAVADDHDNSPQARLSVVGTGPGDANSVTLAAVAVLQSADLVVFDGDVPAATLALARREALKQATPPTTADLIGPLTTALASGQHVAWVGTGNPATCRRWTERIEALRSLPIRPEIVPGLTACPLCSGQCRQEPSGLT